MAAITIQPCRKADSSPAGLAGLPSTATSTATPTARPTWRSMLTTAAPVANEGGGRDAAAVAISVGSVSPTPMPVRIMPPSMSAA